MSRGELAEVAGLCAPAAGATAAGQDTTGRPGSCWGAGAGAGRGHSPSQAYMGGGAPSGGGGLGGGGGLMRRLGLRDALLWQWYVNNLKSESLRFPSK